MALLSVWAASSKHSGLSLTCCRTSSLLLNRANTRHFSFVPSATKQSARHLERAIVTSFDSGLRGSRTFFSFTKSSSPTEPTITAEPVPPPPPPAALDASPTASMQGTGGAPPPEPSPLVASFDAATPPEVVPIDAAAEVSSDVAGLTTTLLPTPLPLEFGDLAAMGLVSWTPAGLIRWSLEVINVVTGMPWFWTIVVGTLLWRLAVAPFVIQNLQNTARLLPVQSRIVALRDEMKRAQGDKLAMQRTALKQKKIYDDAGVSMGKMLITPFIQLPVTLGLFFGLRKMCNLPVEQLRDSGFSLIPDLTVADPFGALPWLVMLAVNIQISAGVRETNLKERPELGHIFNGLRILSLAGVYVMIDFPSGLMVSLLVTSMATTAQTMLMQIPSVRKYFGIPIVAPEHQGKMPSYKETVQWIKNTFKERVEDNKKKQLALWKEKQQQQKRR
ncbi:hypothetical protein HGRIS_006861 [Hohenbuehelia grisea]|uniref:Membrane insertase YidC/Oxa/ALB C-terminal domain-containing protein n=1 Tax=Hohenbuehelia grisea TaxID=104357 RepID=A0ABR3JA87_9AGAR